MNLINNTFSRQETSPSAARQDFFQILDRIAKEREICIINRPDGENLEDKYEVVYKSKWSQLFTIVNRSEFCGWISSTVMFTINKPQNNTGFHSIINDRV